MFESIIFVVSAFAAANVAIYLLWPRKTAEPPAVATGDISLLFAGNRLIDANPEGTTFMESLAAGPDDLARLLGALSPRFDGLKAIFDDPPSGAQRIASRDQLSELRVARHKGLWRLSLTTRDPELSNLTDLHRVHAMEDELRTLRANTEIAPFVAWRQGPDGIITWVNQTYLDLVGELLGQDVAEVWPLPVLFHDTPRIGKGVDRVPQRIKLADASGGAGEKRWFDCSAQKVGSETLYAAVEATDTVAAEARLRDFMQTLTKTFADLPTGLAIFDKARRLVLFNPALTELTTLPVAMLTARPSLTAFLDALRERKMMPEPRDYKEWRTAIAELESAAEEGSYAETWSLSEGQTYRVIGRPHPDGAIALHFEDISAEISLTRRFRAELDLGQAVLDSFDDAVVVFSPPGILTLSNAAYSRLWGHDPSVSLTEVTIADATRAWSSRTAPTPAWGDLRDFVQDDTLRADWTARVQLSDGRPMECRFTPLAGGSTLVAFRLDQPVEIPDTAESAAVLSAI